ncbi:hypothetical protein HanXRQr2_Chr08g0349911 [Helianthus annuus]|uniref:Reverse transcriptase domain-containing protein n=1 Tax=Helianthus annuus TaxID=4232 RepID=A0A9K3IGV9_HELAN|nr:hypothetical protein HanXRQr2_Chr08g0349911 [Helianthus annuus]
MLGFFDFKSSCIPKKWRKWIGASSRASILLNGSPTNEFKITKGLRQGPSSPFLFVIVLEALSIVMNQAVDVGIFRGVKLPNDGPIIYHFCYAGDVISWANGMWITQKTSIGFLDVFL